MAETATKGRKAPGPKEAEARAQREAKAETEVTAGAKAEQESGHDLYQEMLKRISDAGIGKVIPNKRGYSTVKASDGRTAAYVHPGRKGVRVEVNATVADKDGMDAVVTVLKATTK